MQKITINTGVLIMPYKYKVIELKDHKNLTFQEVCDMYEVSHLVMLKQSCKAYNGNIILSLLRMENKPMSPKEISDKLGINAGYVRTTLRRLIDKDLISQYKFGKYISINQ
jgi:predicted transcriptional regulator